MGENRSNILSIFIPEGATNGDVIKALFPNEEIVDTDGACVYYGTKMRFDKDLWNASYMKEVKE